MSNPINQKVFAGAPIRAKTKPGERSSHRKVGTKGETTKPKKGDTRDDGNERYTGTKWVKVNKVKEAKKKAAEGVKAAKDKKGSVYVGR